MLQYFPFLLLCYQLRRQQFYYNLPTFSDIENPKLIMHEACLLPIEPIRQCLEIR